MFWAHYQFSKTYTEYYYLMFVDRAVPRINREFSQFRFIQDLVSLIVTLVRSAEARGDMPRGIDHHTVFDILWSSVHGTAALRVCNRLREGIDADHAVRATLNAVITGLTHAGASTSPLAKRRRRKPR